MKFAFVLLVLCVSATCQQQQRTKKHKSVHDWATPTPYPSQSEEFRNAVKLDGEHTRIKLEPHETPTNFN